jgi:hypothetical protein
VLAAAVLAACGGPTDPAAFPLPPGAARFDPPPVYARWWAQVEACSGLRGDLAAYTWYAVPGAVPHRSGPVAGYADPWNRRAVLADRYREDGAGVRHEMLHLLLGVAFADVEPARQHPPAYFQGRCEGVVDCAADGCADDRGAPPPLAPAGAPTLPVSALDVRVDVEPAAPSRSAADPWFAVVVRVTNPTGGPVWVPLEGAEPGSAPGLTVAGFGYRIGPPGSEASWEGAVRAAPSARVSFLAGQTRQYVVEANAAPAASGLGLISSPVRHRPPAYCTQRLPSRGSSAGERRARCRCWSGPPSSPPHSCRVGHGCAARRVAREYCGRGPDADAPRLRRASASGGAW